MLKCHNLNICKQKTEQKRISNNLEFKLIKGRQDLVLVLFNSAANFLNLIYDVCAETVGSFKLQLKM